MKPKAEKQPRHTCIVCTKKRYERDMRLVAPLARDKKGNLLRAIWQCKEYCGVTSTSYYELETEAGI